MLDGLLGRGFSSKCKSLIKATRTRIDVVRRRKEATQRFLKGNLAQLLSNGLDINAFGRTEEFLAGLNLLACYDFLEQSCEHILKKLSMMQKQRECPEECREAVGSLMFAAARFSDLPELRDLRDALQERYESSLEHFVNQEFFERSAMKPPTVDKKIQLLEDIASELYIKWDSRGFQQRMMANPSLPAQNLAKKHELNPDRDTTFNLPKDNEAAINSNKRDQLVKSKSELNGHWLKATNGGEKSLTRKDEVGHRSFKGVEPTGSGGKPHIGSERKATARDNYDMTPRGRRVKGELRNDELQVKNGSENNLVREDELNNLSFGRGRSTTASGKSSMGSEHNTHRRDNYNTTLGARLEEGDFSSDKLQVSNGRENYSKRKENSDILFFERGDSMSNSQKLHIGSAGNTPPAVIYDISPQRRREVTGNKNEPTQINGNEDSVRKRNGHESLSHGKRSDFIDITTDKNELMRMNGKEEKVHRRERNGSSSKGKRLEVTDSLHEVPNDKVYNLVEEHSVNRDDKKVSLDGYRDYKESNAAKSLKITQKEDTDLLKSKSSFALPPPYVKSKDKLVPPPYVKTIEAQKTGSNRGGASVDPTTQNRYDVDERSERVRLEEDNKSNYEAMGTYGHENDSPLKDRIPLPKPRSIRKKHSKSSNRDALGDSEDLEAPKRSSSSRRRDHHSKKGLKILFEEEHKHKDDEDRKLEKLLLHYSKKPSAYDEEKVRRKMKSQAREASNSEGEASGLPTRSVSLPREQTPSQEQVKVYARANSFQPDKPAGHVHPKLPDYDDLATRFAALRER